MGLFFGSKRRNISAWENALFEGPVNPLVLPDIDLYEEMTKTLIANDCRIILESAKIIAQTSNPEVYEGRQKLIRERYKHLMTLKPFADRSQRKLIRDAEDAYRNVR